MTTALDITQLNKHFNQAVLSRRTISLCLVGCFTLLTLLYFQLGHSANTKTASQVSLALLKARVTDAKHNTEHRLALAEEHIKLGQIKQAIELLPSYENATAKEQRLLRTIKFKAYNLLDEPYKNQLKIELGQDIQQLDIQQVDQTDKSMAEHIGLYSWLAKISVQQQRWLNAARLFNRAGNYQQAFTYYQKIISADISQEAIPIALANKAFDTALQWINLSDQPRRYNDELLSIAVATGQAKLLTPNNSLLSKTFKDREQWHRQSIDLQIAQGRYASALGLLNLVLEETPHDKNLRYKRWQLYRWTNQAQLSLNDAEWLIQYHYSDTVFNAALSDSLALYSYPHTIAFFKHKSSQFELSPDEYTQWFSAHDFNGTWQAANNAINTLLKSAPHSAILLNWKAYFLNAQGKQEQLRQFWPSYSKIDSIPFNTATYFAQAFWLNNNYPQALVVIKQSQIPQNKLTEYWQLNGLLATRAANKEGIQRAYGQLIKLKAAKLQQISHYAEINFGKDHNNKLAWLWTVYKNNKNEALLEYIAGISYLANDVSHIPTIKAELKALTPTQYRPGVLLNLALLQQIAGQNNQALQTINKALELKPQWLQATQTKGWILLALNKTEALDPIYTLGEPNWQQQDWALLLAAIAMQKQHWRQALFLLKQLRQQYPEDINIGFNLYQALQQTGRHRQAKALAQQLHNQLAVNVPAHYINTSLYSANYGLRQTYQYFLATDPNSVKHNPEFWLAHLLKMHANEQALTLFNHLTQTRYNIPVSMQLALAIQQLNKPKITELLNNTNNTYLPPADVTTALQLIGKPHQAMQYAQAALSSQTLNLEQTQQLQTKIINLRDVSSHLINIHQHNNQGLNLKNTGIYGQFVLFKKLLQYQLDTQTIATPRQGNTQRTQWKIAYNSHGADKQWYWQLDGNKQRTGLLGEYKHTLNNKLALHTAIGLKQEMQQNTLSLLNGKQNFVSIASNTKPIQGLTIKLSYQQQRADINHQTINGYALKLYSEYQLFNTQTQLVAYTAYNDQHYINPSFNVSALNTQQNIRLNNYKDLQLGIRLHKGSFGHTAIQNKGLSYLIDAQANYLPESGQLKINWQLGIASKIVGNDRLSLTSTIQALSQQGNNNTTIKLDYTKHY